MNGATIAGSSRYAVEAMATRFELVFVRADRDAARARAIAEEALDEIVALERSLSRFLPASGIAAINAHAASRPVKVDPGLFALLERSVALSEATEGAFDITIGPLSTAWKSLPNAPGAPDGSRTVPTAEEVADARTRVGYRYLLLDPDCSTVSFARDGMSLDLGAAGKGYAIDRAIDVLRSHGISNALLHGGTSSIHALGCGPDGAPWKVRWGNRVFTLRDRALAVSAAHRPHVVDPRTGRPTEAGGAVAVTGPCSLECDVLSTALLVLGAGASLNLRTRFPGYEGWCAPRLKIPASASLAAAR